MAIPLINYCLELRSIVVQVAHRRAQVFVAHSLHHDVWVLGSLHYHSPESVSATVNLQIAGQSQIVGNPAKVLLKTAQLAHSSQGGETATDLKQVLGGEGLREEAKKRAAEEGREDMEELFRSMAKRGRQANLSFFAFTATPKHKTLAAFGRNGEPIHRYTVRQAIEEEFILDVLKYYTTYATYFNLIKACKDDPNVERKKLLRLSRYKEVVHGAVEHRSPRRFCPTWLSASLRRALNKDTRPLHSQSRRGTSECFGNSSQGKRAPKMSLASDPVFDGLLGNPQIRARFIHVRPDDLGLRG